MIISTPYSLFDLLEKSEINLKHVRFVVFDEADCMIGKNHRSKNIKSVPLDTQIKKIIDSCSHKKIQHSLFGATIPSHVEFLAREFLSPNSIRYVVGERSSAIDSVEQKLMFVGTDNAKLFSLLEILKNGYKPPVLIFTQTKLRAQELSENLKIKGFKALHISSDSNSNKYSEASSLFENISAEILVCTDMVARGIDFKEVDLVVNYDFPSSADDYIHRIGRTGRAGHTGKAVTFFSERDKVLLKTIAEIIRKAGQPVSDWILQMRSCSRKSRKRLVQKPPKRQKIAQTNKG